MVVTNNHELPTIEELTVEEVPISTPGLRAAAHHLGENEIFLFYPSLCSLTVCSAHSVLTFCVFRKILFGRERRICDVQTRDKRSA